MCCGTGEKEKADEVLKAKTKENESELVCLYIYILLLCEYAFVCLLDYTGARVVEAVDVYIKRYEDMMNAMGGTCGGCLTSNYCHL